MERHGLGYLAKDLVSGFQGVVVAYTEWYNGCERVTLSPQNLKKDGSALDNQTFDIQQVRFLEQVLPNPFVEFEAPSPDPAPRAAGRTGGPNREGDMQMRAEDPE